MELNGTSALVTGGASGLGEATARMLAQTGARVAILDREAEKVASVASDLGGVAVPADVTSETELSAALNKIAETHGPARIVVNCAGIGPAARILGREGPMPLADYERVIRVNLIGTFNVMRLAAARMQLSTRLKTGNGG